MTRFPPPARALLLGMPLFFALPLSGAAGEADEIVRRSLAVNGGQDLLSRIEFTLEDAGGARKEIRLIMAFKHYPRNGDIDDKVIMFQELPPDRRNVSFLGWLYDPASGRKDDMWLYLPQLRTVRKLSHDHMHHADGRKGEDVFDLSGLQRFELEPRPVGLDTHRLQGSEPVDGHPAYRILSTPRDPATSPYGGILRWIDEEHYLPLQLEYFDATGHPVKRQTIHWQHIGDAWLWREVEAVDLRSGRRTLLRQYDIKVNRGLSDKLFTKRLMRRGPSTLEAMFRQDDSR